MARPFSQGSWLSSGSLKTPSGLPSRSTGTLWCGAGRQGATCWETWAGVSLQLLGSWRKSSEAEWRNSPKGQHYRLLHNDPHKLRGRITPEPEREALSSVITYTALQCPEDTESCDKAEVFIGSSSSTSKQEKKKKRVDLDLKENKLVQSITSFIKIINFIKRDSKKEKHTLRKKNQNF